MPLPAPPLPTQPTEPAGPAPGGDAVEPLLPTELDLFLQQWTPLPMDTDALACMAEPLSAWLDTNADTDADAALNALGAHAGLRATSRPRPSDDNHTGGGGGDDDDEEEDEDEDEDGDDMAASALRRRRVAHSLAEQRRRNLLGDAFKQLQQQLPVVQRSPGLRMRLHAQRHAAHAVWPGSLMCRGCAAKRRFSIIPATTYG